MAITKEGEGQAYLFLSVGSPYSSHGCPIILLDIKLRFQILECGGSIRGCSVAIPSLTHCMQGGPNLVRISGRFAAHHSSCPSPYSDQHMSFRKCHVRIYASMACSCTIPLDVLEDFSMGAPRPSSWDWILYRQGSCLESTLLLVID